MMIRYRFTFGCGMLAICLCAPNTLAQKKPAVSASDFYKRGMLVFQVDPEASLVLFQKAAKQGHADAMIRLGHCFQTGTGTAPNPKQALIWYKKSVEAGTSAAEYQIGSIYETGGRGVPVSYEQAIQWYKKAVQHNSLKACGGLARIYASGMDSTYHDGAEAIKYASILIQKNPEDAENFDLLAAAYARNHEFDKAMKAAAQAAAVSPLDAVEVRQQRKEEYKTGRPYPAIATEEWIQQSAEQGSMWAMLTLAHLHGDRLNEQYDMEKARHWYNKAVEDGSKEAQVPLGELCRRGEGGPVNLPKAFWCFSDAAEADVEAAYAPLARMYVGGNGVRSNYELAQKWYAMALATGNKKIGQENIAVRQLGELINNRSGQEFYEQGKQFAATGLRPDRQISTLNARTSRAFSLYWVAAEKGYPEAMQALAEMYFYGPAYFVRDTDPGQKNGGIPVNYAKALKWYELLHWKGITLPEYEQCKERYLVELQKKRMKEKGR